MFERRLDKDLERSINGLLVCSKEYLIQCKREYIFETKKLGFDTDMIIRQRWKFNKGNVRNQIKSVDSVRTNNGVELIMEGYCEYEEDDPTVPNMIPFVMEFNTRMVTDNVNALEELQNMFNSCKYNDIYISLLLGRCSPSDPVQCGELILGHNYNNKRAKESLEYIERLLS